MELANRALWVPVVLPSIPTRLAHSPSLELKSIRDEASSLSAEFQIISESLLKLEQHESGERYPAGVLGLLAIHVPLSLEPSKELEQVRDKANDSYELFCDCIGRLEARENAEAGVFIDLTSE
jgi:hypothetical protein